jgi:peroxiredoxin
MNGFDNGGAVAQKRSNPRRLFYVITGGLIALSVLAGILVALGGSRGAGANLSSVFGKPNLTEDVDTAFADAVLVKAANAVGFHSTMDGSVGLVENLSAESAQLQGNPYLLPLGAQAPDFALQTPTGQRVRLSDEKGKTVLLEFFTTWSAACQAEAEHIVAIRAAMSAKKFDFLLVNGDGEDAASLYAFDRSFALPYSTLLDPGGGAGSFSSPGSAGPVTKAYAIRTYPTFYIIDRNGFVAWSSEGEQPDALLQKKLKEISGI